MRSATAFALLLTTLIVSSARAEEHRRGPLEWRDEFLLSQTRLAPRPRGADLAPPGRLRLRLAFDWGNDFGWDQEPPGEMPDDRRFLVDGEHRGLELDASVSLSERWEVGLLVPYRWRGGGVLDDVIDWWHRFLSVRDNLRSFYEQDRFRVDGRTASFDPIAWQGGSGGGLGNVELRGRFALADARADPRSWALALGVGLALPTGTGPFASDSVDFSLDTQAAKSVARELDIHLGAGATHYGKSDLGGIGYRQNRGYGFVAVEWRVARKLSLLLQFDGATRLVESIADFPASHVYMRIGAKLDLGQRWRLEGGFSENVKHQQATTDFSITAAVTRRF